MQTWETRIMNLLLLLSLALPVEASSDWQWMSEPRSATSPATALAPRVTLQAATGRTIEFRTQNGRTVRGHRPQTQIVPHLVLRRNGALTDPAERTLEITASHIQVPPAGMTITLTIETQHAAPAQDSDLRDEPGARITIWRETRRLTSDPSASTQPVTVTFRPRFGETVAWGSGTTPTPTDYFRIELVALTAGHFASEPLYALSQDAAFLLERQETVALGRQHGVGGGAGPERLTVYYCDMFPFQRDAHDPASRLRREEIPGYVQRELLPAMLEAIRVETQDWGFAWSPAWTSWRDGDASHLGVALSDGETWYHGEAPEGGSSAISIRVNGGHNADYGTLTDGIMSVFYHELFHNLQRSMAQELAGHGDVAGRSGAWMFFSEGTAVLASSVGLPAVQFDQTGTSRAYLARANTYIGGSGYAGDLNTSYVEMTPYHAAMYWRFLYEQCGGLEDAHASMGLIRHALAALYSQGGEDLAASTGRSGATALVRHLPAIMDAVLSSPGAASCPWRTYADSLVHFSQAIYGLRVKGGRCTQAGVPAGCGVYDPHGLYNAPRVSTLVYRGQALTFDAAAQPYPPGIRSSYGVDFVEVVLDDEVDGQPLSLTFSGDPAGQARFSVQVWQLVDDGTGSSWQPSLRAASPPDALLWEGADGHVVYTIPQIEPGVCNRLGVIITRVDSQEDLDATGTYTLELQASGTRGDSAAGSD